MTVVTPTALATARLEYEREGWYRSPLRLSEAEVAKIQSSVDRISTEDRPEVVYERDSKVIRAIHGCHEFDAVCADLVRLPALVDLAEELLGEPGYVYQFKVNLKQPHEGAAWPWHQDYSFWSNEDGMPTDHAVNIAVFLDDTHEGNGPLTVLPRTHRRGVIRGYDELAAEGADWRQHVSASLKYTVPDHVVDALERTHGRRQLAIGPVGTVFAFHPSIVHSSSNNLSADRRALLLISYNAVSNAPPRPTRPGFLVSRDTAPVVRLDRDTL